MSLKNFLLEEALIAKSEMSKHDSTYWHECEYHGSYYEICITRENGISVVAYPMHWLDDILVTDLSVWFEINDELLTGN